ncbi:MAG: hypothetical protein HY701_05250, partial [Gemmatimonadetes bacterium]|nr:hypothetical protein [Gemmatimonadota bacterium]
MSPHKSSLIATVLAVALAALPTSLAAQSTARYVPEPVRGGPFELSIQ